MSAAPDGLPVRVQALEAAIAKQLERDYYPVAPAIARSVMRTPALLEALDTIDRARELHHEPACCTVCHGCRRPSPCPTLQALNPTEGEAHV